MGKKRKKAKRLNKQLTFIASNQSAAPEGIVLDLMTPGIYIGSAGRDDAYAGIPQGTDGNALIVGYTGSGKTTSIAIPTLATWDGTVFAIDVKGELGANYQRLYEQGIASRPYIAFTPSREDTVSYDVFWWLGEDGEENVSSNLLDLAQTLIPTVPGDPEPFWVQGEQQVLAALLHAGYMRGLGFSQTVAWVLNSDLTQLCKQLRKEGNAIETMLLGNIEDNPKMLAAIERGLRNRLSVFATDPHIAHAFRGAREGAIIFTWRDLEKCNVFLNIPADKIEIWAPAIRIMTAQLLRYLERRPDQYTAEGKEVTRTLLLLDEFPRLGELPMITDAVATLRSKQVNFMIFCQSLAQLDCIYGKHERAIITDNCSYLAVLGANDPDTQRYLADRIGTYLRQEHSLSGQVDKWLDPVGYAWQTGECRDYVVQPHELSTLTDVLMLSPHGFYRLDKLDPINNLPERILSARDQAYRTQWLHLKARPADPEDANRRNIDAELLTPEERLESATKRISEFEREQAQEKARLSRERKIDELIETMFPALPAGAAEGTSYQERRNAVLYNIASDPTAVKYLRRQVRDHTPKPGAIVPMKPDVEVDTRQGKERENGGNVPC